jgi:hypothetical protein
MDQDSWRRWHTLDISEGRFWLLEWDCPLLVLLCWGTSRFPGWDEWCLFTPSFDKIASFHHRKLHLLLDELHFAVYGHLPTKFQLADWEGTIAWHSAVPGVLVCLKHHFHSGVAVLFSLIGILWILWLFLPIALEHTDMSCYCEPGYLPVCLNANSTQRFQEISYKWSCVLPKGFYRNRSNIIPQ